MSSTCPCCNQLIPYGHGCNSHSSALEVMGIHAESELKQKQLELLVKIKNEFTLEYVGQNQSMFIEEIIDKEIERIGDV